MTAFATARRAKPTKWIVAHGDSILRGVGSSDVNGAHRLNMVSLVADAARIAHGYTFGDLNFSLDGQGFNLIGTPGFGNLIDDATMRVDPVLERDGTKYLLLFAGSNDIHNTGGNHSGTTTAALLQTYVAARIAAGWTPALIFVCTMLPRQNGLYESERTVFNSDVRFHAAGAGYTVVDLAANATIGPAGADQNSTYFEDATHLKDPGHAIAAPIISALMFP